MTGFLIIAALTVPFFLCMAFALGPCIRSAQISRERGE